MKRYGNIYDKIYDYENLKMAHKQARRNKTLAKRLKKKMRNILAKVESGQQMSYSDWCSINSYKGWLMWCDGYNLTQKYIAPLKSYADDFYREAVLKCELEEQC